MQQNTVRTLSIALFVLLLGWGFYTFLFYLGVPGHGVVLLGDKGYETVVGQCTNSGEICRGFFSLFAFLEHSAVRAAPFLWYAVVCLVIYAAVLGFQVLKGRALACRWTLKPWHIIVFFVASLWLIFTTLTLSMGDNDIPLRRLVEPTPEIYSGTSAEGLKVLRENFDGLMQRGCLILKGTYNNGVKGYDVSVRCIQQSFVTRVFAPLAFIALLLAEFLVLGSMVLGWLKLKPVSSLTETVLSLGMGACGFIVILWSLAVASYHLTGIALYTMTAGWVVLALVPIVGFRHVLYWLRKLKDTVWTLDERWYSVLILLSWLVISYLAFNFLTVVRPFPIGWDDLGSYLNRPRLLVSFGQFIYSMAPFQWEYITSLGFMLFGYESFFGATISMLINWMAGLLALLTVFMFARHFLGTGRGVLAALLYYTLPMVGHFSFADMKVDNAVFTMGALSMFCVFAFLAQEFGTQEQTDRHSGSWLMVAGIFGGFAFAMKPTTIMTLLATGAVLCGVLLHWSAFVGVVLLSIFIFVFQGTLSLQDVAARIFGQGASISDSVFLGVCLLLGLVCVGWAMWKRRDRLWFMLRAGIIFAGFFLITLFPWVEHNNILRGTFIPHADFGAPNNITPVFDVTGTLDPNQYKNLIPIPKELRVDKTNPACKATGSTEELGRYWGEQKGWGHYLLLPWRSVNNIDATGYYVTTIPALLLVPLLLLLPFFWTQRGRWLRWLFLATGFMLLQWMFLASGIVWYGVGMFLGFVVLLETLLAKAPDVPNRMVTGVLLTLSLFSAFGMRFWQFESQRNLLEYPMGKSSAEVMTERTIPHYNDIANTVVERAKTLKDRPYLYRVGTFIPYFIPRNLEIIGIADHQLDFFNCLYQERDPKLTIARLKAMGINSIVFDTNTATIERESDGTLHQKVNAFIDFLNTPDVGLKVVVSDAKAGVAFILVD
ncbi:TPA: hypothetical protein DCL30_01425 [Candidatus Peribacteria bacterium]|nr:MAG: hypothetical protein A2529_02795 [Candidatus Peribacteria bacterium RIFOXYD2_FULL_58_15]HAI98187.1 hypothetical protein [Candidatus Peribacteria bacterium]HAS34532.1 hypothetical protein [Candidatus Peribacteria bacterium]